MVADQQLRYAESFAGNTTVVFPLAGYEYTPGQDFRPASAAVVGADYEYDFAGIDPWPKKPGTESVRFLLVGADPAALSAAYDDILASLINAGLGQLWTTDSAGDRRWAYCKLDSRPGYTSSVKMWGYTAVTVKFRRYSDWYGEDQISSSVHLTTNGQLFSLTNPGNAPARFMTFRLRSSSASGFSAPAIQNTLNGYQIGSTRVASSALDEVKIDTERFLAQWSTDDGLTYSDDYSNVVRGPKQVGFMRLEPGSNPMKFINTGAANAELDYAYWAPYH